MSEDLIAIEQEKEQHARARRQGLRAEFVQQALAGRHLVPPHLWDGTFRYVIDGGHTGHFLCAVFENDLREAIARGDETSIAGLNGLVQFLYNYAPPGCWGSKDKHNRWLQCGGIMGAEI